MRFVSAVFVRVHGVGKRFSLTVTLLGDVPINRLHLSLPTLNQFLLVPHLTTDFSLLLLLHHLIRLLLLSLKFALVRLVSHIMLARSLEIRQVPTGPFAPTLLFSVGFRQFQSVVALI